MFYQREIPCGTVEQVVKTILLQTPEAYLEICQVSVMEPFLKKVTPQSRLLFLQKTTIIDVWQNLQYVYESYSIFNWK